MGTFIRGQIFRRETQVWEFATFKCFRLKNNQNWPRYRQKTEPAMSFKDSFRYGDHTLGFQIKGRETIALVFAQPRFFLFFQYWQNFAIKSMFGPNWHIFGLILPDFGVHLSGSPTTSLILVKETKYLILVKETKNQNEVPGKWFPRPWRSWLLSIFFQPAVFQKLLLEY